MILYYQITNVRLNTMILMITGYFQATWFQSCFVISYRFPKSNLIHSIFK